jgi:formylglycine-generating enzyme required for sulfatase activity
VDVPPQNIGGFRILATIGRGAMGTVFRARQVSLDRDVALKVMADHLVHDPGYVARFYREARSAAKLRHPNIVQAYDFGEHQGTYYFAMELIGGESVGQVLQRSGRLPTLEVVRIAEQVARALEYAWDHARIIHRDIKPDNLLLDADGTVKIADLGLAKSTETPSEVSQVMGAAGTPNYLSPEQATRSDNIDARTDIYSLGCVLFHLLTGSVPYDGDTSASVILRHLYDPVPDPRDKAEGVPEDVADFIVRMMAKDPAQRPQTWGDVAAFFDGVRGRMETGDLNDAGEMAQSQDEEEEESAGAVRSGLLNTALISAGSIAAILLIASAVYFGLGAYRETPPSWAEVSPDQVRAAREAGVPVAREIDLGNGQVLQMVLIPAGQFAMGSEDGYPDEKPRRLVRVSRPFYMSRCEVTQAQYRLIMGANPSAFQGPDHPVEQVTWADATRFCERVGRRAGFLVRLPTEAEWEYACRAGADTPYFFGASPAALDEYAWYQANARGQTHPVGLKRSNPWGLRDVYGNVWEWCRDWFDEAYYASGDPVDPPGPAMGSRRSLRGGAWDRTAENVRSSVRGYSPPDKPGPADGFRVVAVPSTEAP